MGKASFGGTQKVKYAGATFGGAVTGVLLSLAVLIVASIVRHATLQGVSFPAMKDVTINGNYVALGDSYAAGEGLKPFEAVTVKSQCDRSEHYGYSRLLAPHLTGSATPRFKACAGSVVADIYALHTRNGVPVPAQVGPGTYPDVKLVTIMSGGNDVGFAKLLQQCYEHAHCLTTTFSSGRHGMPAPEQLDRWGRDAIKALAGEEHDLYVKLHMSFPNARIIVISYPYLFTAGRATWVPDDCATVTRRFSQSERDWVRDRIDELDNMLYAETAETGLEFISPHDAWVGHEPCGSKGEFTNEINLGNLNELSGSFHPNRNGAHELAVLIGTYLHDNPTQPSPFTSADHPSLNVTTDFCPIILGLKAPFGDAAPRCP
jgi:GDSL-like Lipase/Acylhydrolase family